MSETSAPTAQVSLILRRPCVSNANCVVIVAVSASTVALSCNFNLHGECAPMPQTYEHDYHIHSLTLHGSLVEDISGEYFFDLCEQRRNQELGVSYCAEY